ncbi:MAG: GTP cyclohydrolase 1 [Candidatus Daviesbacteria bacterium GW2011_GWB1_39_5]|uniref:GTP cyclohydrolase 1 n=1 Tax=Candidatus Nomurabacteria bacterium GW2011_GWF2_43_8 TaxID=1618779 RepID=A0A0G1FHT2_9BACT|nr:MAG: GTP cyclohydrolase 1 [Candidatus Daviesbacteria bacterium GW2011_GWB1_39_5]KKR60998.1 MAG: GTP cyclohydrolase 1 [Parcubacteria group bacterium GW2011_GWA2_40_37]KKT21921.1 MAG: GTP cyclohydrolase 1 [Candidatus Nomurabacteria bacterium GW2011_GWF2_43_8]
MSRKNKEQIVRDMLMAIGENPNRQGLKNTPKRITRMWEEIFSGYDKKNKPSITVFPNKTDGVEYNQMIIDTGYFYSHCEHHGVPFFGKYYFAYIPNKKIMGLSKVSRTIDYFSSRLQIQERLVKDVVDEIEKVVQPKGVALVMKARHLCKEMRGVKKIDGEMTTSDVRGAFRKNALTRNEFMSLIGL